jgi:hypothetical protein
MSSKTGLSARGRAAALSRKANRHLREAERLTAQAADASTSS